MGVLHLLAVLEIAMPISECLMNEDGKGEHPLPTAPGAFACSFLPFLLMFSHLCMLMCLASCVLGKILCVDTKHSLSPGPLMPPNERQSSGSSSNSSEPGHFLAVVAALPGPNDAMD